MNLQTFRSPILASMYRILGGISALGAVLLVILVIVFYAIGGDFAAVPLGMSGSLIIAGMSLLSSVVLFGIAQVIDLIARSAYHLGRIDTLIASQAAVHRQDSRPTAASIPTGYGTAKGQRVTGIDSVATAACPSCMAELDVRTLRRGQNKCPSCGTTFTAE